MKLDTLLFALKQVRFVKSPADFKILSDQIPFFMQRLTNHYVKDTIVPPSLQIEPTNYCNLKCISCPRDTMSRKKGYMEFGLFQKIIDDATNIGIHRVHFYLHGEPLLHPDIVKMIRYMKTKRIGINLITNGMLMDKKKSLDILKSDVNFSDCITFSILGDSKEVHENVMKGVDHDRVFNNVIDFIKLRKKLRTHGPTIETVFYTMPENAHELHMYFKRWKSIADHARCGPDVSKSYAEYKKTDDNNMPLRRKTCMNIWERMTIHWNGDVSLCCEDIDGDYVVGNMSDKTIKEAWNSDILLSYRALHKEKKFGEIALCKNCDLFSP
jgi:radical SAM protein with 4Fe4S-binding SPASM domain